MDIAATRTDGKAAIYIDNMRQSMQRCGEIYLSMARDVYVEEGREVDTLGEDGKQHGTATLSEGTPTSKAGFRIRHDIAKGGTRSSPTCRRRPPPAATRPSARW
jgi:hypothetical protein